MAESESRALDYATPQQQASLWRAVPWQIRMVPVCSALIILSHLLVGGSDDPFWFVALALPVGVGTAAAIRRHWSGAVYCFVTLAFLLLISAILPMLRL